METIVLPRTDGPRNLARVVAFISALPTNKPWRVRIDEYKGDRTDRQNAALFGVAYPPLCKYLNCLDEDLHDVMCQKFFGVKTILGVQKPLRTTTRGVDGKRDVIDFEKFSNFYAMVQQVGAELPDPVWVPDPDRSLRTR